MGVLAALIGLLYLYPEEWILGRVIKQFYANASTELIGITITVLIVDYLIECREERQLKSRLISEMRSRYNVIALRAVNEMRFLHDWLEDGSLQNVYLFRANLKGAGLSGANLRNAGLMETKLKNADLSQSDLSGSILNHADLRGSDLSMANLSGAYLEGADLRGADLTLANMHKAKLDETTKIDDKWRLIWKIVNYGGANRALKGVDLSGADLTNTDLRGADLRGAILNIVSLCGADLRGANLTGVDLIETLYNSSTKWPKGFDPEKVGDFPVNDDKPPTPTPGVE